MEPFTAGVTIGIIIYMLVVGPVNKQEKKREIASDKAPIVKEVKTTKKEATDGIIKR